MRGIGGAGFFAMALGGLAVWRIGDLTDLVAAVVILGISLVVFRN